MSAHPPAPLHRQSKRRTDPGRRPQRPARDCNERSLLRRFGAGVKVITIVEVETYTAYREETVREESASSFNMSLDGGVGGSVY